MTHMTPSSPVVARGLTRRTVATGAAWAVPVVAMASAAPAMAASCAPYGTPTVVVVDPASGTARAGSGTNGLACWGPGKGSGSNGCTGATEPQRYWFVRDNSSSGSANTTAWYSLTRTTTIPGVAPGQTYTFCATMRTNWGNACSLATYPAAVVILTDNGSGGLAPLTTWYATSATITTPPIVGIGSSPTVVAPQTNTATNCGTQYFSAATTVPITVVVPPAATNQTIRIQYQFFAQNRTCATYNPQFQLCAGNSTTANDDIGLSDPVWISCGPTAGACP